MNTVVIKTELKEVKTRRPKTHKIVPGCQSFKVMAVSTTILSQHKTFKKPQSIVKRKRISVTPSAIIQNMVYSPSIAAENIGVSISTLRRRYAEFNCGSHWPITEQECVKMPKQPKNKGALTTIIQNFEREETKLDPLTISMLTCAFKQHQL